MAVDPRASVVAADERVRRNITTTTQARKGQQTAAVQALYQRSRPKSPPPLASPGNVLKLLTTVVGSGMNGVQTGKVLDAVRQYQATGELHPLLQKLTKKLPWLDINSGVRSTAEQKQLWAEALKKYGDPEVADNYVARPGTSKHEKGFAVDVHKNDIARLLQWLSNHPRFGGRIFRPMSYEPWHFEVRS